MTKCLLIRPGAIGDFIVSIPAMEAFRAGYTEVWCAGQNVALAGFADRARSIASVGLDRLGIVAAEDVIERLRSFDAIFSWYGSNRPEFVRLMRELELPFQFFPALPDNSRHAVDFYCGGTGGALSGFPRIQCPAAAREFAVVHPFASSRAKRAPLETFEGIARKLSVHMPVHWLCGPEEHLSGAVRIENLHELACWLRRARIFVGNDSGISHLAAAVGTPVIVLFRDSDSRIWSPRGLSIDVLHVSRVSSGTGHDVIENP